MQCLPTIPSWGRREPAAKSLHWACATRGGRASTAPPETSTSPTWARTPGKKSTSARRAPTTVGIISRAQRSSPGETPLVPGRWSPIYSYNHNGMSASITGGYVYRGDGAALQGQYFFADFVQGKVFTLAFNGSAWVATDRTSQIVTDIGSLTLPSSFGEDGRGNLYIVDLGGNIFRLTPTVFSAP